ncbi:hypothetical protein IDH44_16890 [Paenibacillus sp. IB182496]|uniref:Uncharacterized protein n=1 Tax=Paenibacillus sabuli TaxID=2772509 RepID=A0A927BW77_9BACL|nr:hypothetical protein [Paenibacillus sabuli]MBD2846875.1 hypothetical protein [Paenibacillus sabuli]
MTQPKLGLQGPVVAWHDPWAGEISDEIMRTGTGSVYPSQDPAPPPGAFVEAMQTLGADFYVHHMLPNLAGQSEMIRDMTRHGMDVCLGNEYGNINGPYVAGTNRYDVPDEPLLEAAKSGRLIGLLYDEPEHLQINAAQYLKKDFLPHWGRTDGLAPAQASERLAVSVAARDRHVRELLAGAGLDPAAAPLVAEQVFPVLFHAQASAGMTPCPKVMKESFQSLQLATALGAARQYGRAMWICADLWGPDVGEWFIRTSGFPGHSPEEYESALRMAYYMSPSHLFTENIDVLLRYDGERFSRTEFGDVWASFVREFVPAHPLSWSHADADPDIVFIHSDDSNYGQNARLFGNRELEGTHESQSIFHVWHLLSHGTIPAHGSCMHIPGYTFPRQQLKAEVPTKDFPLAHGRAFPEEDRVHTLFHPVNNVLVYDETVGADVLGHPGLIVAAGSRLSARTLQALRQRAEDGADVVIASWLIAPQAWRESGRVGSGRWLVTDDFLDDPRVRETLAPHLGAPDCWMQRFGDTEVRMYRGDARGFTLDFEVGVRS